MRNLQSEADHGKKPVDLIYPQLVILHKQIPRRVEAVQSLDKAQGRCVDAVLWELKQKDAENWSRHGKQKEQDVDCLGPKQASFEPDLGLVELSQRLLSVIARLFALGVLLAHGNN